MSAPLAPPLSVAPGVDLYAGDCLDVLATLAVGSVQCCVTSPPYLGLRDYPVAPRAWPAMAYAPMAGLPPVEVPAMVCQLGQEPTIEAFIGHLLLVFREVARLLRADGTCWVNLGDSYAAARAPVVHQGKHAWMGGARNRSTLPPGLAAKNLCGIPWRFALAMQADGWVLRSEVIWSKRNPMPSSVRDRPTTAHEQLFLFVRGTRYFYDAEAIAEPLADPERRNRAEGPSAFRGQASLRPRGRSGNKERKSRNDHGGIPGHPSHQAFGVPWEGDSRNKRSVWSIASQPYAAAHFATFPEALVEPCLLAGTSERGRCAACGKPWARLTEHFRTLDGERCDDVPAMRSTSKAAPSGAQGVSHMRTGSVRRTIGWASGCSCGAPVEPCVVLDPFAGSGTVGAVARRLGRGAVLVEASTEYAGLIVERVTAPPRVRRERRPKPTAQAAEQLPLFGSQS